MPSGSDLQDIYPLRVFECVFRRIPILIDLPRSQTTKSRLDVENADRAITHIMQHIKEGGTCQTKSVLQFLVLKKPGVRLEARLTFKCCIDFLWTILPISCDVALGFAP